MTGSSFEPQEGRLQMTLPALAAMPALLQQDLISLDRHLLEELSDGGIVADGALHPQLVTLARCVAAPGVRLRLERSSDPSFHTDGWLDDRLAVLFRMQSGATAGDVVAIPRGMVPFRLARLVELGPRPRVKVVDPVELDEGLLETLLAAGAGLTGSQISTLLGRDDEVIPEWMGILVRLSEGRATRWRVGAWWNTTEESPVARSLEVADSEAGSFLIVRRRREGRRYRRAALYPLTSTQIWRLLCALVPAPAEVSEPLTH